ncbi:serine/threonine protein kinase, partial [Dulcicalothrix desertica]|uniref:serine/threonine protein kinase n=1 Tax=Dulcicalothrix desertica TaxID=32056 RepID=UPI0011A47ECE
EVQKQLGKKAGRKTVLAQDAQTGQMVIIKLLNFSSDFVWEDLKLFEREAETLKSLAHPAIPSYIDYFEVEEGNRSCALVQTYIEGQSLEQYMQTGRIFIEDELRDIAEQLLQILIYLHEQHPPVIHRDIKPSNIILVENLKGKVGKVYLVDFGSVQTLASKAGKTVTVVGTYGYMPPEQFGGYATPASDLYGLGATLIALATATHPADLPQKDMRLEFAELVNFTPAFIEWLEWLTEPSADKRLKTPMAALQALLTGQMRSDGDYTAIDTISHSAIAQPINSTQLFWETVWRSVVYGGGMVTLTAGLYTTIWAPGIGTIFGGYVGALLGIPLGIVNGILIALITRLFFFPLKNAYLYRRVVNMTSAIFSTASALYYFKALLYNHANVNIQELLFLTVAPSLITALCMGVASRSIVNFYENRHRKIRSQRFYSYFQAQEEE